MSKKRICIVTGSRAEWGLFYPLACEIAKEKEHFSLLIIAAAAHLSNDHGMTYKEIEKDGFKADWKAEIPVAEDTEQAIAKSVGVGIAAFAEAFGSLKPDLVFLLGDRFETFSAAAASLFSKIAVAHIHGGELTEGSLDDSLRHCITKMAEFHFVSTEVYRKRVIQMGEEPSRVFNVGALGLDNIKNTKLLSKDAFEKETGIRLGKRNVLVTFNPSTAEDRVTCEEQIDNLLRVLDGFKDLKTIFTKPNPDMYSRAIAAKIDDYAARNPVGSVSLTSMGRVLYLSALKLVDLVAGNSSSGIIEAPSFGIPVVNIGNRQKGRIRAESIIDIGGSFESINDAFKKALYDDEFKESCKTSKSHYGDGTASKKIIDVIKKVEIMTAKKGFYDINYSIQN
jgi:GDP/UDP-N,N'-diacetylbacillosamine 2-epimerase (hydrolysing)